MPEEVISQQVPQPEQGNLGNGIISPERMAEISQQAKEITDKVVPQPAVSPVEKKVETPTTPVVEVPKTEVKTETPSNLDELKKTTFFADLATTPTTPVEIKDWDTAAKFMSETTGTEIKDFSDVQKLTTEYKSLKEQSGKITDYENKLNNFENIFASLPDDLFEATQRFLRKEDYKSFLKDGLKDTIDFNIPFEKQTKKEILDYYFPGKFSDEDYQDEDNKAVSFAMEQANLKFADEKKASETKKITYREKHDQDQQAIAEKLKTTAVSSWNNFSQGKNIEAARKNKLATIMEGGYNGVFGMLFDKDGGWKTDAAENLASLLFAKEDNAIAKRVIQSQAKTIEEFISRGADNPTIKKSSVQGETTEEDAAKKYVEQMLK
jgi:hypothetical protein